jgi:Flp pilus assembly protein TadG
MWNMNGRHESLSNERPVAGKRRSRRGASLIEFTMLGIPGIFLCTSVMCASINMWQFFTMSYAAEQTARYAAMHGASCGSPNSCTITRANVASFFEAEAIALIPASTTLKLTDGSGTITCNPVSSCPSSSSQFPAAADNSVGSNITISVSYTITNPIIMLWPSAGIVSPSRFTLGATSTQEILY